MSSSDGIETSTFTPVEFTSSEQPQEQVTVTSTNIPVTLTPTIMKTNTPQSTPYLTPPFLSEEDAFELIAELYKTNGGCEPPCWWGITPGETSLHDAFELLLSIGEIFDDTYIYKTERIYSINILTPQGFRYFSNARVNLGTPRSPSDPYYGIVTGVSVDDTYSKPYNNYGLADYLGLLGEPDQVYLGISYIYVFFTLFYVDEGLTIYNHQTINEIQSDIEFLACPQNEIADTWHWIARNPNTVTLEDMISTAKNGPYYLPLEDVTEITINEFYEIYLDPDTDYCIEGNVYQ